MVIFVFAGIFTYFFVYEITKNSLASFFSALFYTFLPNHLIEIFEGHLGLSMTYTLTPLVFLLLEKSSKSVSLYLTIFAGFAVASLLLTHPQAVCLIGPFIFAYCLFNIFALHPFKKAREFIKTIVIIFAPLIIGLLLSAYWWLPLFFERNLFQGMKFSLESTKQYTQPFLNIITFWLRSCCSPNTAFVNSPPPISIILLYAPLIALSAPILLHKNRYVIFFSITGLTAITLAMGIYSPIPLFTFTFKYIPLFDGIRTPSRFLFFAAFAFSILAGFTIVSIYSRLRKSHEIFLVLFILSLWLIGPVYGPSQEAFQTFDLEPSQKEAMAWLSGQDEGRLVPLPWHTWINTPETRNIVFPWNYVHLHKKEVVSGGVPSLALQNTADLLDILKSKIYNERISLSKLVDILGIKYVVLDRNYLGYLGEERYKTIYADLESSDHFEKVWSEGNVTIFKNLNVFPRIFLQTKDEIKYIDVFENTTFVWKWAEGTQPAKLSWSGEVVLTGKYSLRSDYNFTKKSRDWLHIGTNVEGIEFKDFDAISFWYYLPEPQPNIRISINVLEKDKSKYMALIYPTDTSRGWHNVEVPFALMELVSEDENRQLDKDQIAALWIGVTETENYEENKTFTIYFDNMTLIKYKYSFNSVSFRLIHSGKYRVHVKVDEPSYLVLSESYHPRWVAKDARTGNVIARSIPLYIALNGFPLEEGEYELILEFEDGAPQRIGTLISIITLTICMGCLVYDLIRRRKITKRTLEEK